MSKPPVYPKFAGKYASPGFTPRIIRGPVVTTVYHRETPRIDSLNPTDMGQAPKRDNPRYTGTAVLGIATMHKSNLVPIFNPEAAVDAATMRRN